MKRKPSFDDIFKEIRFLDREANINGVIAKTAAHYSVLRTLKPELLERISHYLKTCPTVISPESIAALKGLPEKDLEHAGITAAVKDLPSAAPRPDPGRICFPVITSMGLAREVRVADASQSALSPRRLQLLDQAGSPVFSALRRKLKRPFLWRPERYRYQIFNAFEKEDPDVTGDSLGLPLALALYSHVTQTPVPSDLSATGKVLRDGSILPISGLKKKLLALKQERWLVRRVLMPAQQETISAIPGIEFIKVKSIDEAIDRVFPSTVIPRATFAEIDLKEALKEIEKQYDRYLIDACIENTGELLAYIESSQPPIPKDRAVPARFTCYWRRGSCYCHKGNVKETKTNLDAAEKLFQKFPGFIHESDYWDSRINYAVLLKDIFRYPDAEALHHQIHEKMEQVGALDHEKGKNLSSRSQLCLAQGRFAEAEALQKMAIPLIQEADRQRNYGYLAQVYIRAGEFKKAASNLSKAANLLERRGVKSDDRPFYDWFFSEYLYRYGTTLKAARKRHWAKFEPLISRYPEVTWYVPGLIHKFAGLAMLDLGDEAGGLQKLDGVISYFDAQVDPVVRLLGVSVRVERCLYLLQKDPPEKVVHDLGKIREDVGLQKDIKRFFDGELSQITRYLRLKRPGQSNFVEILNALSSFRKKIPY